VAGTVELPDGAAVALFGNRADMIGPAFGEFNDSLKAGHAAHPACSTAPRYERA
jgi:hypothetical protein